MGYASKSSSKTETTTVVRELRPATTPDKIVDNYAKFAEKNQDELEEVGAIYDEEGKLLKNINGKTGQIHVDSKDVVGNYYVHYHPAVGFEMRGDEFALSTAAAPPSGPDIGNMLMREQKEMAVVTHRYNTNISFSVQKDPDITPKSMYDDPDELVKNKYGNQQQWMDQATIDDLKRQRRDPSSFKIVRRGDYYWSLQTEWNHKMVAATKSPKVDKKMEAWEKRYKEAHAKEIEADPLLFKNTTSEEVRTYFVDQECFEATQKVAAKYGLLYTRRIHNPRKMEKWKKEHMVE